LATIFTRIIEGELPARFAWKAERCVAFLSINPLRSGHVLVVPREEVDHWLDLDENLMVHTMNVSRSIGRAIQKGFEPSKVELLIAGLEVCTTCTFTWCPSTDSTTWISITPPKTPTPRSWTGPPA
jgi:histidine triad (HIT) family protein